MKSLIILALLTLGATAAEAQESLVNRLYLDVAGEAPSSSQRTGTASDFSAANSPAELRAIVGEKVLKLMEDNKAEFQKRLSQYFNGLFGMADRHGRYSPKCENADATMSECSTSIREQYFRDELSMYIAKSIVEGNTNSVDVEGNPYPSEAEDNPYPVEPPSFDIREILTSDKTVMNSEMAKYLSFNKNNADGILSRIGLQNIDRGMLEFISSSSDPEKWWWIDRDISDQGLATGTDGHKEKHAGVLTTNAYLKRGGSHLGRASNFYSWFLCRSLEQSPVEESNDLKLANKAPCSGCHSLLEPLGSFWVNWRASVDINSTSQQWILDGVDRPEELNGAVPIDIDDQESVHSRSSAGAFRDISGSGALRLGEGIQNEPEFAQCMATHMWQFMMGRKLDPSESGWPKRLGQKLANQYNWNLREVLIDIVLTKSYSKEDQ